MHFDLHVIQAFSIFDIFGTPALNKNTSPLPSKFPALNSNVVFSFADVCKIICE